MTVRRFLRRLYFYTAALPKAESYINPHDRYWDYLPLTGALKSERLFTIPSGSLPAAIAGVTQQRQRTAAPAAVQYRRFTLFGFIGFQRFFLFRFMFCILHVNKIKIVQRAERIGQVGQRVIRRALRLVDVWLRLAIRSQPDVGMALEVLFLIQHGIFAANK